MERVSHTVVDGIGEVDCHTAIVEMVDKAAQGEALTVGNCPRAVEDVRQGLVESLR